mmetsp:Transcript_19218/g.46390  ORF Transcript_19218/g.46390 Transcript_19218/m.46390 type:complete len:289 (+) Transcript_19218:655-1521(+)
MLTPEGSFNSHVLNEDKVKKDLSGGLLRMLTRILHGHAKTIARRWVASAMKGRDTSKKEVWLQQRIPLGLKVRHSLATKAEDDIFYGAKYIVDKTDGAVYLHVEFVGTMKDGYSPMKDDASIRSAAAEFAYAPDAAATVPPVINLMSSEEDDDSTWQDWKTTAEDDVSLSQSITAMSISSKTSNNRNPSGLKKTAGSKRSAKGKAKPKQKTTPKSTPTTPKSTTPKSTPPTVAGMPAAAASGGFATSPMSTRSGRNVSPPKRYKHDNLFVETVDSKDEEDDVDEKKQN